MNKVTFITSNRKKVEYIEKYLGFSVGQKMLELEELQSLDLRKIVEHKARQAYGQVKSPVLVEDVSFRIGAIGKLPGPFIKWFIEEVGFEGLCRLADTDESRAAYAGICYGYFDGRRVEFFEGELKGTMPQHPSGDDGFGWNCVFIPEGQSKTNAEMTEKEVERYSLRTATIYPKLKEFLEGVDNK